MPCTLKYATLHCRGKLCLITEHDQYMSKAPRLIMFCAATKYVLKFFNFFATEFGTLRYAVSVKCTFGLLCSKDKCMDLFFLSGHSILKLVNEDIYKQTCQFRKEIITAVVIILSLMKEFFKDSETFSYISLCICKLYEKLIGFHYGERFLDVNSLLICLPKPLRH